MLMCVCRRVRSQYLNFALRARSLKTGPPSPAPLSTGPKVTSFNYNDMPNSLEQPEVSTSSTGSFLDARKLPPSLRLVREMMNLSKDSVVLTQMGGFYELYFEHATEFAPKLNITLTQKRVTREGSTDKYIIPMAGFPVAQLDKFLKILVQELGQGVAIADQFKRDSVANNDPLKYSRRITRIVTPGTLVDESFMNQHENNYLLSIALPEHCTDRPVDPSIAVGLCWIDVSLGATFVQETGIENLMPAITSINPKEIILDESLLSQNLQDGSWYPELVELKRYLVKYQTLPSRHIPLDMYKQMFDCDAFSWKQSISEITVKEGSALRRSLSYVQRHLPDIKLNLQLPKRQISSQVMQIDSRAAEALELHKSYRNDSSQGSVLSAIKRTVSSSGSRLLSQWLSAPSMSIKEIKQRHKLISLFLKNTQLRNDLIGRLKSVHDITRIIQRISFSRSQPLDLVYLAHSLREIDSIREIIHEASKETKAGSNLLAPILEKLKFKSELAISILDNLDEEALMRHIRAIEDQKNLDSKALRDNTSQSSKESTENIWTVRPHASNVLTRLHREYRELLDRKANFEEDLRSKLPAARTISLKYQPNLGHQVYLISNPKHFDDLSKILPGATITQKSRSTRWLRHPTWSQLGTEIDGQISLIKREEERILGFLRTEIIKQSHELRNIANVLDYLDVTSSFAVLAREKNLTCPKVDTSYDLKITQGRHLVVEDGLSSNLQQFEPNDCVLNPEKLFWLISGPNMGGKSTFLRQNAIIIILAQIGCYVPAKSAKIGLVDKIFSRVGSADDLFNELSTFMVEMIETSYILNGATERSLAILDEVGRGTSGDEGLAIAYAALSYLLTKNKCRGLFATHYGQEIYNLLENNSLSSKIGFKRTTIEQLGPEITYNHKLTDGISHKSFAINVAQRAGFPQNAILEATKALEHISLTKKQIGIKASN